MPGLTGANSSSEIRMLRAYRRNPPTNVLSLADQNPRQRREPPDPPGQPSGSSARVGGLAPRREQVIAAACAAPPISRVRDAWASGMPAPYAPIAPSVTRIASRADMNESPAPTVSTVLTVGASTQASAFFVYAAAPEAPWVTTTSSVRSP